MSYLAKLCSDSESPFHVVRESIPARNDGGIVVELNEGEGEGENRSEVRLK